MAYWQVMLLILPAGGILLLAVLSRARKGRSRRQRDFTRRLETLLLAGEEIQIICGTSGRWILTNKRLILEEGEAFAAFPLGKIQKVSGLDPSGKATVAAGKMQVLTVKLPDRELTLRRRAPEFEPLVKGLKAGVSAAKKKK